MTHAQLGRGNGVPLSQKGGQGKLEENRNEPTPRYQHVEKWEEKKGEALSLPQKEKNRGRKHPN